MRPILMNLMAIAICLSIPVTVARAEEDASAKEIEADLKALREGASKYLAANDQVWPQPPRAAFGDEKAFWEFWFAALAPYGVKPEHWKHSKDSSNKPSSYMATGFDPKPRTAYRWENQPWFMQAFGDTREPRIVLPDGSVKAIRIPAAKKKPDDPAD